MSNEQRKVLKEVVETLTTVVENKEEQYTHVVYDGVTRKESIVNREEHLESMIEWAIDYIVENVEMEEEEHDSQRPIKTDL